MIFADMVGAEYLNSGNPKTLETPLDILLKKLGGDFLLQMLYSCTGYTKKFCMYVDRGIS